MLKESAGDSLKGSSVVGRTTGPAHFLVTSRELILLHHLSNLIENKLAEKKRRKCIVSPHDPSEFL